MTKYLDIYSDLIKLAAQMAKGEGVPDWSERVFSTGTPSYERRDMLSALRMADEAGITHALQLRAIADRLSAEMRSSNEPCEQRPADGTRDGDGVWQGGFWHPDTPDPLDEWQLMEFAPKDGTRILALITEVQFYRDTATPNELIPVVVKWTGEYSGWSMPGHGGLRPTLWLPIKLTNDSQGASRDASPADLVGALQDVVHTDPGPVRAGKAHRDASSDVHTQMHKCEHCGALTKIDCVSDFQLIQYICGTCGKETRAHEVFEAHEKRT